MYAQYRCSQTCIAGTCSVHTLRTMQADRAFMDLCVDMNILSSSTPGCCRGMKKSCLQEPLRFRQQGTWGCFH